MSVKMIVVFLQALLLPDLILVSTSGADTGSTLSLVRNLGPSPLPPPPLVVFGNMVGLTPPSWLLNVVYQRVISDVIVIFYCLTVDLHYVSCSP